MHDGTEFADEQVQKVQGGDLKSSEDIKTTSNPLLKRQKQVPIFHFRSKPQNMLTMASSANNNIGIKEEAKVTQSFPHIYDSIKNPSFEEDNDVPR